MKFFQKKINLEYGFPQGSKIGPFGFKLYAKPIAAIAKKHGVTFTFRSSKFSSCNFADGGMYRGDKILDGRQLPQTE